MQFWLCSSLGDVPSLSSLLSSFKTILMNSQETVAIVNLLLRMSLPHLNFCWSILLNSYPNDLQMFESYLFEFIDLAISKIQDRTQPPP